MTVVLRLTVFGRNKLTIFTDYERARTRLENAATDHGFGIQENGLITKDGKRCGNWKITSE